MQARITIEYDGSNYFGWQLQAGQDSIQARLEDALRRIFSTPVRVRGSGRTDAGVHALGQIAAFTIPRPFDLGELRRALNALLPRDIVVLGVAEAADDFDPRRHARWRVYQYRVLNRAIRSAFEYRYSWQVSAPLDLDAMNRAARLFIGDHDFAAFRTLGTEVKDTVRRVLESEWSREGERFTYRVEASSFLRHMVRTMATAMVDAGRGKTSSERISELLASRDRADAPAPAPPGGLFLIEVRY